MVEIATGAADLHSANSDNHPACDGYVMRSNYLPWFNSFRRTLPLT
jgi:hypothetical protein